MSGPNKPSPALNAATGQDSQEDLGKAAKHPKTSVYQAPYYPYPECRNPGEYLITFQPGYTLAEHFTFLGFEVELIGLLNNGYYAALNDQVFNAIRYDPGVKLIEDDVLGEVD
jgi:hypothetical protein